MAEAEPAFAISEVEDMSQTVSPSTARRYGLALVCRVWEVNRFTVYGVRTRTNSATPDPGKRGPKTELSDQQLTELIRETITTSPGWAR